MKSLSPIAILWHQWTLSISYIFNACMCNLNSPHPFSSFSSLSIFCRVLILFWPALPHWMMVTVIYQTNYDSETLKLCCHILQKGCASGNAFILKEKFCAQISRKVKKLEALKETVLKVCLQAISWICEWKIFFFHSLLWQKKNNLRKETLKSFMLTYLLPNEFSCDLLCDIYFQKISVLMIKLIINLTN